MFESFRIGLTFFDWHTSVRSAGSGQLGRGVRFGHEFGGGEPDMSGNTRAPGRSPVPAHDQPSTTGATAMPEPILEAKNLVKSFGKVRALRGASFTVYPQEVVALIGDNGAGKSTLVKTLVGRASSRQRRDPLRGQAGVDRDAARLARSRDRDRLPGPRPRRGDRPRREHVPGPRDHARRVPREARVPRQGRDAQAQRRGLRLARGQDPGHRARAWRTCPAVSARASRSAAR